MEFFTKTVNKPGSDIGLIRFYILLDFKMVALYSDVTTRHNYKIITL